MQIINHIFFIFIALTVLNSDYFCLAQSRSLSQCTGLYGGTIKNISISPEGTLFLSNSVGELFYSNDYGETWKKKNIDSTKKVINSITVDKRGYLYLSTSDGLYFSKNDGNNWKLLISESTRFYFYKTVTDSKGLIYAAWSNSEIFRSTDDGFSWTQLVNKPFTNSFFFDIFLDSKNTIFLSSTKGLYRSTDNGNQWIKSDSGISISPSNQYRIFNIQEDSSGTMYSRIDNYGISYSSNQGISWENSNPNSYIFSSIMYFISDIEVQKTLKQMIKYNV